MARRLRGIAADGTKYVVHFDREWREWQVRAYRKNKAGVWKFAEGPTCYCEDRKDATQTFYHLVGHAPAGTHVNPKLKTTVVAVQAPNGHGWVLVYKHGKMFGGRASSHVYGSKKEAETEARGMTNPPKRYIMHAQGYGPGPTFESKAAAILAIRALVREDVRHCRRHFGSAFVENWGNKVWEVRPVRYRGPGYVMWSRYSLSEV